MSAVAITLVGFGCLLIWAGLTGHPLLQSIQQVLSGAKAGK